MPQRTTKDCRRLLLGAALCHLVGCAVTSESADGSRPTRADDTVEAQTRPASFRGPDRSRPATSNRLFQQARQWVERHTGTDLSRITLQIVDDPTIDQAVRDETARLVDSQFTSASFKAHFLDDVMSEQAGTYAALFSHERSAILVSRTLLDHLLGSVADAPEVRDATVLALFIHELVHAADDARHDIQTHRTLSFRASFAQSATFEGHAQYITRQICRDVGCLPGLQALDDFMFGRHDPPQSSLPAVQAISRNILEYSYIEGERFVTAIAARPSGELLLEQLLSTPPHDPVQILAPDTYPDVAREARNQRMIQAARDVDHPWTRNPWQVLETSPLKGVNLRANPERRQAAIDGFTRLLTAIVAVQLYDQSVPEQAPREATLLRATNEATARLFAESLHQNTHTPAALLDTQAIMLDEQTPSHLLPPAPVEATLYRTRTSGVAGADAGERQVRTDDAPAEGTRWHTVIAHSGAFVVQISGEAREETLLERYAIQLLSQLLDSDDADDAVIATSLSTNSR